MAQDTGKLRIALTGQALIHEGLRRVAPPEPDVLDALKEMGFNLLSTANNHAWDLGKAGLLAGIGEAKKRGFVIAGTGADLKEAGAAGYLDTPAGKVALIAMASGAGQLASPDTRAAPGRLAHVSKSRGRRRGWR